MNASPSRAPAASAVVLVATAWAFLPLDHLPSFDAVKLPVLALLVACAAFLSARRRAADATESALRDPLLAVAAVLALVAACAAVLAWPSGSLAGPSLALVCIVAARLVRPGSDGVRSTLRGAAVASAGVAAYALVQALGGDPAPWGARREVVSTLGNTSFAAEFQAAALPLALGLTLLPGASSRDRWLGRAAVLLAAVHLVLARSRIDIAAALAAALVVAALVLRDRRRARVVAAAGAAAAIAGAALFVAAAAGQLSWLGRTDTLRVRALVWEATVRLVGDRPLALSGAPFVDLFPPFRDPDEYRISLGRVVDTPHCDLLEIAATLGVAGALVALVWVALLARRVAAVRSQHPAEAAALGGAIVAILVSGLASSPLTHPATALLLALSVGHVVALAPRPLTRPAWTARSADFAACAAAVAVLWPGPALRTLRSDGFHALAMADKLGGRPADAARMFDAACAADPQAFAPRYELGSLLHGRGESGAAVAALRAAHALRPGDPDCRTNLVYSLRAAGRTDEADRLLDDSLALVPWHPLLLAARASRSTARGDHAAAAADLARAAELRPFDLHVRAVRAEAALATDPGEASRTEAADVLEALVESGDERLLRMAGRAFAARDPVFLAVLSTRAKRLVGERPQVAARLVDAPIDGLTPPDPGYFLTASEVFRAAGFEEGATRLLGRSLGLRAREELARGEPDAARRTASQAAERDPIPEHLVTEVLALARLGERRAVREALSAALALGPVDAAALRADPAFAALLPDPGLEALLARAPVGMRR